MAKDEVTLPDWKADAFIKAVKSGITKGMRKAVKMLAADAKGILGGPAPSPEGGPPGKVDGELRDAIAYKVKQKPRYVTGVFGVLKDGDIQAKAARLAGGYVGRDRLGRVYSQGPRPYLAPTLERKENEVTALICGGGFPEGGG